MANRMDRYGEQDGLSRALKNRNLYDTLYDSKEYSIKTDERTISRTNYKDDNVKRSLKENPYEIREKIEKFKEEEKPEVIDDMFGDLIDTKTLKEASIKEMINKEKKDDSDKDTMALGLVDKDFEELKDMHESIKKNNVLLKIFLGILIFAALLVTAYAIYKII